MQASTPTARPPSSSCGPKPISNATAFPLACLRRATFSTRKHCGQCSSNWWPNFRKAASRVQRAGKSPCGSPAVLSHRSPKTPCTLCGPRRQTRRFLHGMMPPHLYRQREATSLPLHKAILPQKRCPRQGDSSATRTLLLRSRQEEEIIAFLPSQAILLVKSQHKQDETTLFKASVSGRG